MRKASVPRLFYKIAEQQNKRRQEGGIYRRHCIPFPDIVLLFEFDHEENRIITITPSCNIAATFFVMKGIKIRRMTLYHTAVRIFYLSK